MIRREAKRLKLERRALGRRRSARAPAIRMPTHLSSSSVLVQTGVECRSGDLPLGQELWPLQNASACEALCEATLSCRFFIFGVGEKAGNCFHEFSATASCPEGFEHDEYEFYRMLRWRLVGSALVRRGVECLSADAELGVFVGRVDECAAACQRRGGGATRIRNG